MKKLSLLLVACLAFLAATTQPKNSYRFSVNLDNVQRDRLLVELSTPAIKKNEITYRLPKIIPGYYNESNFGRFVEDLAAKDKAGNPLPVVRTGPNAWKISGAAQLATISYWVNDTYDDTTGNPIFEPCGSSIQADTAFVLNTHCLLGYFDGMTQLPYRLTVKHPQHLYGATALTDADPGNTTDLFTTENYNRMADNPVLYARPDTATIQTGQSTILFAVYSPNKKVSARYIADNCRALMQAQAAYLGGTLPVKKYAFLIYLSEQPGLTGATGALEHSYSSTYFTTEDEPETVMQFIRDNAAHEFFHILTPLNIHSEEIHYFDFDHPKMSKHLWLYEGSTEYHSMLVQARYKLVSQEEFLQGVSQRITASRRFFNDTLSFTEMSAGVLHEHAGQFGNVYQKGALIALCLDIQLLALSKGKYGLMHLVNASVCG